MLIRIALMVLAAAGICFGAEERIRGVLEKTARPDACAQIRDALDETYFVNKSDASEKMIAKYLGRNIAVIIAGDVESRPGNQGLFINLKSVEPAPTAGKPSGDGKK